MSTTVINIKDAPPGWQDDPQYVYIGRANGRAGLKASTWANPLRIGKDGTREEVIEGYRDYAIRNGFDEEARYLRGRILVCWCAPQACHGDLLARWADAGGDE